MKVDLTRDQLQVIVNSLDTHLRANGIQVAKAVTGTVDVIVAALQTEESANETDQAQES